MSLNLSLKALALSLLTLPFLAQTGKALEGSMHADYVKTFSPGDPVMGLGIGLSHKLNKSVGLFVSQDVDKNLVVDASTDEIEFRDTRFGLRLYPRSLIENVSWVISLSATLPVSKTSRDYEIYSKPEVSFGANYIPWSWLSVDGSVFARYNVSKYETAPAQGEYGGQALQKYSYGFSQGMSIQNETFSLGYSFGYRESQYYKIEQSAATNALISDLPDQGYSIGIYASANVWEKGSLTLGFSQGDALIQKGFEDYVLYDKEESSWSIGFVQGF